MNFVWLNKEEKNSSLIVFFNGWGFDETAVKHLSYSGFDVLVLFDYRDLNFDFKQFDFKKYDKKYLICWSMGVYVSNLFKSEFNDFDRKIAINGTQKMIDDEFGIPKRIYILTLSRFNEKSCEKFVQNMFNGNGSVKLKRPTEELKEELESLNNLKITDFLKFDKACISTEDRIVPSKNQVNYWLNRTSTELLSAPHYPFNLFKSWEELI
ncbi:DUF452 family protein [bacterium]|nr:DUF452 family protein [bacterium]